MTLFTDLRTKLNNSNTRQKVVIPSLIVSAPACFFAAPANALTFTCQMKILLKTIKTHCFSAFPSPFALGAIAVTVFGAWVSNPAQAAVITYEVRTRALNSTDIGGVPQKTPSCLHIRLGSR